MMFLDYILTSVALGMTFLLGCTGEILTEKAGHLNLGIPGIMCIGGASGCLALKLCYGLPGMLVVPIAIIASIIGGALGLLLVSYFKKFKRQQVLKVFDMVSPGVMLGQIIGRWGNFVNGEAHGVQTSESFFLRMGLLPNEDSRHRMYFYHPTFLYESLWNLVGFVLINLFYKKKRFDGQITLMYLAWYGFGRMFIEGLRTDSLYIGPFRISQVVGFLCFMICTALLVWQWVKSRRLANDSEEEYIPVYEKLRGIKHESAVMPEKKEEEAESGKTD